MATASIPQKSRQASTVADGEQRRRDSIDKEKADSHVVTAVSAVDEPPDGGYGWVIVICVFFANGVWCLAFRSLVADDDPC